MAQPLDNKTQQALNNFFTSEITPKQFSHIMHEFMHEVITLHLSGSNTSGYTMSNDVLSNGYFYITKLIELTNEEIPYSKPIDELLS